MMGWLWRIADDCRHRARLKRWQPHLAWGARGEDLAHRHLQALGYKIISRNWRRPGRKHEIDIVALDGHRLVIVEVKSRHDNLFASPDRNVDAAKRLHTGLAALDFARQYRIERSRIRFDLVTVVFEPFSIEHIPDAWSLKTSGLG